MTERASQSAAAAADPLAMADLGQRIRRLRKLKHMRLKDLAARAGCSESLLSKVECNRAMPSLRMLHSIVSALDSNIGSLFDETAEDEVLVYRPGERPVVTVADEDGATAIRLERLGPYGGEQQLEGHVHVVAPGANNGGEIKHQGEEIGYVIEGELNLTVGGRTYRLRAGDSFYFPSELPHAYENPSDAVAKVLWINTPPTF